MHLNQSVAEWWCRHRYRRRRRRRHCHRSLFNLNHIRTCLLLIYYVIGFHFFGMDQCEMNVTVTALFEMR